MSYFKPLAQRAEARDAVDAVLRGCVASIVFRNAVAAVPRDVDFHRRFLDALAPFTFPGEEGVPNSSAQGLRRFSFVFVLSKGHLKARISIPSAWCNRKGSEQARQSNETRYLL